MNPQELRNLLTEVRHGRQSVDGAIRQLKSPAIPRPGICARYDKRWLGSLSVITGPSRTADIERILVLGTHGPKQLMLFLEDRTLGVVKEAQCE